MLLSIHKTPNYHCIQVCLLSIYINYKIDRRLELTQKLSELVIFVNSTEWQAELCKYLHPPPLKKIIISGQLKQSFFYFLMEKTLKFSLVNQSFA